MVIDHCSVLQERQSDLKDQYEGVCCIIVEFVRRFAGRRAPLVVFRFGGLFNHGELGCSGQSKS